MSGSVRARRPPSPTPTTSARFPHPRENHLDADTRRDLASKGFAPSRLTTGKYYPPGGVNLSSGEWKLLIVVIALALFVRLWKLSKPNSVVFDEVHFGKFASKYIKTTYFVDVHPPLAKLLITLAGFLFGYDGKFDFKDIGKVYESVPYIAMRMVPALLGVATVPLSYLTLRALDCRATTALLASLFVTFENGLVTQSRHILLDSPLIFFTALTVFLWVCFCNEDRHQPFTETWWTFLVLSGLSLGAVLSCKWVGLFTVATVGFNTVYQLWTLLGDLRVPPKTFVRHFTARALCLIAIPIVFYMFMFQIHFLLLGSSGDGDGFMSAEFQHTLGGRGMHDTFADIAFGSELSIRHVNTQGGYLHSHPHNYPAGSGQQQITLYPHRDTNNNWRILNATKDALEEIDWAHEDLEYILHHTKVKLVHINTDKRLHSHDVRPPVSDVDFQNEVSAYGMAGFAGDANDDWIVEIEKGDKRDKHSSKRLRTLRTTFRLRHALQGCYLFSHKVKLPDWGWEQQEVTCNKNAVRDNSLWYVETNAHAALPKDAEKVNYRLPGFFSKFWELQRVMWTTNAGLTERHTYDSRPESWPWLRRGINFWVKDHRHIYLLGNPTIWWLSSASVLAYLLARGLLILRAQRGYQDFSNTRVVKYDALCGFLCMGWALHYLPFFLMGRQLFLHHYLPALYFSILLLCSVFDMVTGTLKARIRMQIALVLVLVAIWNFWYLSPLAYGGEWTKGACRNAKWLKTWDFSCNELYDNYGQYSPTHDATPTKSTFSIAPQVTVVGGEEGGRAAIVVEQPIPDDDEAGSTVVIGHGQPEPGRDIFADKKGGDQGSSRVPKRPQQDEDKVVFEEKEISTVSDAPLTTAVPDVVVAPPEEKGDSSAAEGVDTTSHPVVPEHDDDLPAKVAADEKPTEKVEEAEKDEEDAKPKKAQGPLDEEEHVADQVAKELFGDEQVE